MFTFTRIYFLFYFNCILIQVFILLLKYKMWILFPTLRLLALLQTRWVGFHQISHQEKIQVKERKREGTNRGSGEDDEERQRIPLKSWSSVSSTWAGCCSDEADSCCLWLVLARRNHLQLFASELSSSVTDTHGSSGIKPVPTWGRLRGNWRFCAGFGRMFDSQRNFWLPSDNFELLLDGLGLFSWRNAPGDPRVYKDQSVLRRKHANFKGTSWFFDLLDVFWSWILVQGWKTKKK